MIRTVVFSTCGCGVVHTVANTTLVWSYTQTLDGIFGSSHLPSFRQRTLKQFNSFVILWCQVEVNNINITTLNSFPPLNSKHSQFVKCWIAVGKKLTAIWEWKNVVWQTEGLKWVGCTILISVEFGPDFFGVGRSFE